MLYGDMLWQGLTVYEGTPLLLPTEPKSKWSVWAGGWECCCLSAQDMGISRPLTALKHVTET